MASTKIKGISKQFARILSEYTDEVEELINQSKTTVSKETVKQLKSTSPKDTGGYAKGWRVTDVRGKKVIHNKTDYQLTHLLEYGHAKVGGGRVPAKVHIRPAEEKAINEFVEKVEKGLRG